MGQSTPSNLWPRFAPRLRRAIAGALEAAGHRGHEQAAPEHLLQAIAADSESAAAFIFEHAGLSRSDILAQIDKFSPRGSAEKLQRASQLSPSAMLLLDVAAAESNRFEDDHIGTEHIALAMIRTHGHMASDVLGRLGLTAQAADEARRAWLLLGMPRRRTGLDKWIIRRPGLRKVIRPIQAIARPPMLAWNVYFRRSLGHPQFVANPYPLYRWLRKNDPVRKDPLAPVWIVTRYEDVSLALRDPRFRKDPFAAERLPRAAREQLNAPMTSARSDIETVSMLFLDPPQHTRVRAMFSQAFGPRMIEQMRPRIEQIARRRLDQALEVGQLDIIRDLAYPLPVIVIAEILGFPSEDYERIKRWSDDMTEALSLRPTDEAQQRAAAAREELREYFDRLVPVIKKHPRDDLLSALLAREGQGESLNREEIFSNAVLLLAAGHETTTNLIGNGMLALLENPDQLDALRKDPRLIGSAVDEMLRYDSPVQWTSRVAGESVELGGQRIERGEVVLAALGSANRDEAQFPDPDLFDIRRSPNRHLAFGQGIHYCLGATLAKMEAEIAVAQVLARCPKLRLPNANRTRIPGLTFRGIRALPVRVK